MTVHVDALGRSWRPFKRFTCPNHPDGPPTLPADGYEREELTIDQAFDHEELADLMTLWTAGRRQAPEAAGRVEQMLGLCCIGHRWKVAGFRQMSKSDVALSSMADLLVSMRAPLLSHSILLDELSGNLPAGRELRIPLILEGTPLPRSAAAEAALTREGTSGVKQLFSRRYSLDPVKPPTIES